MQAESLLSEPTVKPSTFPLALLCSENESEVTQSSLTLCDPMDCSPPGYSVHRILQARILEWVAISFSRGSSQPRDQTQVSHLQEDSLPAEPPRKPKNTGVGSLSLLQWIFLTQELNQGLLHCRQIVYLPNYQGNPKTCKVFF